MYHRLSMEFGQCYKVEIADDQDVFCLDFYGNYSYCKKLVDLVE